MSKQWNKWHNVQAIKESGQAHIFKVQNEDTRVLGALKRLKNPKRLDRFANEVAIARKLSHPNIAAMLDSDLEFEEPYAVYEWVDGGSLGDIPPDRLATIPLDQRLTWCQQVCNALTHAHAHGAIHRDIKPDNVLLDQDTLSVKLCDFGLVFMEDGDRVTATMEQVGSRYFIPPECEEGRVDEVSPASDLYSLGKLIYYMASGGRIFAREQHRQPKYKLAVQLGNPFLEHISVLLDRLILHNPKDREQSARVVADLIVQARNKLEMNAPARGKPETHICMFCHEGYYKVVAVSQDGTQAHNSGYGSEGNIGNEQFIFVECNNCGNAQKFKWKHGAGHWFATEDPAKPGDPRVRSANLHLRPDASR